MDYIGNQISFLSTHLAVHEIHLPFDGPVPSQITERLPYTFRGLERLCTGLEAAGWDVNIDLRTPLGVLGAQYSLLDGAVNGFEARLRNELISAEKVVLNGFKELPAPEAYATVRNYGYFLGAACNLTTVRYALHRIG